MFFELILDTLFFSARKHPGSPDFISSTRKLLQETCGKPGLDWPEAIWEQYITFEHLFGTVDEIEDCLSRVAKAKKGVEGKRDKVSYTVGALNCGCFHFAVILCY